MRPSLIPIFLLVLASFCFGCLFGIKFPHETIVEPEVQMRGIDLDLEAIECSEHLRKFRAGEIEVAKTKVA